MVKHVADGVSFPDKANSKNRSVSMLVLCVCVMLVASCARYPDDPGWIAGELVEAFVTADIERAKSVTVPEQWDRLEEQMEGRQPFRCRGVKWGDPMGAGGSGNYSATNNEWNWGLVYQCPSQRTPYCLEINDIQVRETEEGWKVYDWGKICEAFNYAYRCGEICDN